MVKNTPTYSAFPAPRTHKVNSAGYVEIHSDFSKMAGFLIFAVIALVWNAFTWGLFISPSKSKLDGFNILGIIFICVGAFLIFMAVKNLFRVLMVGDTYLVMESDIIAPGETHKVQIYHTGRYEIENVAVRLQGQEKVAERVGKDKKTFNAQLYNEKVFEGGKRFSKPGMPLYEFELNIPETVPYSFYTRSQRITWGLDVKLNLPGRPDMDLSYTLRVGNRQLAEAEGKKGKPHA